MYSMETSKHLYKAADLFRVIDTRVHRGQLHCAFKYINPEDYSLFASRILGLPSPHFNYDKSTLVGLIDTLKENYKEVDTNMCSGDMRKLATVFPDIIDLMRFVEDNVIRISPDNEIAFIHKGVYSKLNIK